MLAQSLSGLAAQKVNEGDFDELVWIEVGSEEYRYLFDRTVKRLEIASISDSDVWSLTRKYHDSGIVNGYILYSQDDDPELPSDCSINVATSMAGPLKGLLIDVSLEPAAKEMGLNMLFDARGKRLSDVFSKHNSDFNRNLVLAADPSKPQMRDMAIAHKCLAVYGTDETVETVFKWLNPLSAVMGWNIGDEFDHVSLATKWGHFETVSDWCINIPVISAGSSDADITPVRPYKPWEIDFNKTSDFVAFLYSDGDNVQWNMGGFNFNERLWASEQHGLFPMSWTTASANLIQVSPETQNHKAKTQPRSTSLVDFSGGYFYPDLFAVERSNREQLLREYAKRYSKELKRTGINVICFICENLKSQEAIEAYNIFAEEISDLIGMVAIQYAPYDGGDGEVFWPKNRQGTSIPVISVKYTTWQGAGWERGGSPEKIANLLKSDNDARQSFSVVANHAWSKYSMNGQQYSDLAAVAYLHNRIKDNVSVVNIEEMIWRLRMDHDRKQTIERIRLLKKVHR